MVQNILDTPPSMEYLNKTFYILEVRTKQGLLIHYQVIGSSKLEELTDTLHSVMDNITGTLLCDKYCGIKVSITCAPRKEFLG